MVGALNILQSWLNEDLLVNKAVLTWQFEEAEYNLRTDEVECNLRTLKYDSRDLVISIKLERVEVELDWRTIQYNNVHDRLLGMDWMWCVLYEVARTNMATLDQSVQSLNDSGRVAYETLKTRAVALAAMVGEAAVEQTILKSELDDTALTTFHKWHSRYSEKASDRLRKHRAKLLRVFGEKIDTEINAGCSDKCSGCSKTDAARRMVDAVRRMGFNNISDTDEVIENIGELKKVFGTISSMSEFKQRTSPSGHLQTKTADFSQYALLDYTEHIRKFPQMSFYYKLDPTHLDVLLPLHFLLMNALKSAFAAPGDVQQLSWKLVPPKAVDFDEDSTNPAFVANQNLLNIPIPEFVLDHWKETMEKKTTKKKTTKKKTMKEVTDEGAGTN
eukprot:GHVS01050001.1.p1 GENE.GHVS01050001.1~~GHVS01050001.1.p1  ORF type:complete len:388 (-),score=43.58 GHVS01050001.1:80-1243(-)